MRRQIVAMSVLFVGWLAGCETEPKYVGDGYVRPSVNGPVGQQVRSQKPDNEPAKLQPPKSLLDMPPEKPADANIVQVCASIRAVVNGKAILDEEVRQACFAALRATLSENMTTQERIARQKQILTTTLELLVERELLMQDALGKLGKSPQGQKFLEKMKELSNKEFDRWLRNLKTALNLKTDEEIRDWLAGQGLSVEGMRKQKEKQYIAEEYLRQMVMPYVDAVGHSQIVEYYRQHPEEFQVGDSVKWQDLFIDVTQYASRAEAKKVADQIAARIRAREDFIKLAELYDPRGFRFTHGDGYGQKRGEIQPREVESTLFGLRDGEVGVVEMPSGYHVVRVLKRTYAGRMPLDDKLQAQIRDKLRNEVGIREQKSFLNRLKANATIEYASAH
jgi:hypothetical protein